MPPFDPLVFRDVKGTPLDEFEGDANVRELEFRAGRAPVVITASTQLTVEAHGNRELQVDSPTAVQLTLPASAPLGVKFFGTNLGPGAVTLRLSGGEPVPGSSILAATSAQFDPFEVRARTGGFVRVA